MNEIEIIIEQIDLLDLGIETPELTFIVEGQPFLEVPTHMHNIDNITITQFQLAELDSILYS